MGRCVDPRAASPRRSASRRLLSVCSTAAVSTSASAVSTGTVNVVSLASVEADSALSEGSGVRKTAHEQARLAHGPQARRGEVDGAELRAQGGGQRETKNT